MKSKGKLDSLFDAGLLSICDECDYADHTDSLGWLLLKDGRVLCSSCKVTEGFVNLNDELTIKGHIEIENGQNNRGDINEPIDPIQILYSQGFTEWKLDKKGQWITNEYECTFCKSKWMFNIWGMEGHVSYVAHDYTDNTSHWGAGIPTTRRECSCCKRWDGPWVSASVVGGGW